MTCSMTPAEARFKVRPLTRRREGRNRREVPPKSAVTRWHERKPARRVPLAFMCNGSKSRNRPRHQGPGREETFMKYLVAAAAALSLAGGGAVAQTGQPYQGGYGPNGGAQPYGYGAPGAPRYQSYGGNAGDCGD